MPLILTERREDVEALRTRFERFTRNLVVLHGGLKSAELREAQVGLRASTQVNAWSSQLADIWAKCSTTHVTTRCFL